MKRLIPVLLVLLLAAPAIAQKPVAKPTKPAAAAAASNTIWDHQKELGLTDDQVTQIKAAVAGLQNKLKEVQTQGVTLKTQLDALVTNDASDEAAVRAKYQEIANLEIDFHLADLEATRAIHKILSKEQLARWQTIQAANRKPAN